MIRARKALKDIDGDKYHRTKLLLEIYRTLVWRIQDSLTDLDQVREELGASKISSMEDFLHIDLEVFRGPQEGEALESRLMNIYESKLMIQLVDRALAKLRRSPENGEIYYRLIRETYIDEEKLSQAEIMERNNISHSTYYRYKKEAINLLGLILWGHILPELRILWQEEEVAEEKDSYETKLIQV